jgi:hypothetical protein
MREALASELRKAYWESKAELDSWHKSDHEAKQAWRRVADVAIGIIQTTVAHARPDSVRKGHEMRQALWTIIEEAQIALKAD